MLISVHPDFALIKVTKVLYLIVLNAVKER